MMDKDSSASPRLVRIRGMQAICSLSRSSALLQVKLGELPPPVKLGNRSVAWVVAELDAWVSARIRGASPGEMRRLVAELVTLRAGGIEAKTSERLTEYEDKETKGEMT